MQYQPVRHNHPTRRGFSLVELVIVVVIIGIIGAIAIPRLSRGSEGATEAAITQNTAVINRALEHYAAEHRGSYPTPALVQQQLTQYTDAAGNVSATRTSTHIYGPYIRSIPPAPAGEAPGSTKISVVDAADVGWLYHATEGRVELNDEGFTPVNIPLSL